MQFNFARQPSSRCTSSSSRASKADVKKLIDLSLTFSGSMERTAAMTSKMKLPGIGKLDGFLRIDAALQLGPSSDFCWKD